MKEVIKKIVSKFASYGCFLSFDNSGLPREIKNFYNGVRNFLIADSTDAIILSNFLPKMP